MNSLIRSGKVSFKTILLLVMIIFIIVLFFIPLCTILLRGFTNSTGNFSLFQITEILKTDYYRGVIFFTFYQALLSTVFSILLGLPGAYILSHFTFKGKSVLKAITTVPFVLPSILVVLGFVLLFGNNGILNRALMKLFNLENPPLHILYSMKAIILAHGFYNFPVCIRIVSSVWEKISLSTVYAAKNLGAKRFRLFFTITLPQILPGILAGASLIFMFCFMSFAIILVLGGGPEYTTLEVEVYRAAKFSVDLNKVSALSIISVAFSLVIMYCYVRLQKTLSFSEKPDSIYRPKKGLKQMFKGIQGIFFLIYILLIFIIIISPLLAIFIRSFQYRTGWAGDLNFSIQWYKQLFSSASATEYSSAPFIAVKNSFFFAIMTVLFALPIGTALAFLFNRGKTAKFKLAESFLMLPMGISSIVLALGYTRVMHLLNYDGNASKLLIIFAHTIIAYPFVVRSLSSTISKIHSSLPYAAATLGAAPLRIFHTIYLPLIKSGLLSGACFAFAISIGEVNATLLLAKHDSITIPIAMYRLIASYNFFEACALGVILMLLCFAAFLVIDKLEGTGD